jgi:hypothetical protein
MKYPRDDSKKFRDRHSASDLNDAKSSADHIYFKDSDAKSVSFKTGSPSSGVYDPRTTDDRTESEELLGYPL